jgi:DNA modification methylase
MAARKRTAAPPTEPQAIPTRPGRPGAQSAVSEEFAWVPLDRLVPWAKNPRINQKAVSKVAASINEFGWVRPIIANLHPDCINEIIVGHTARLAAVSLGLTEVPVRFVHLDPERAHAAALADNKLGEISAWDPAILGELIASSAIGKPLFTLAGFTPFEFDRLGRPPTADQDAVPDRPKRPITRVGDLWQLGRHRVICGDSTLAEVAARCLAGAVPKLLITDPPYGVKYDPRWREQSVNKTSAGALINSKHTNKVANDDRPSWLDAYALFPGDVCYVWHADLYGHIVRAELTGKGIAFVNGQVREVPIELPARNPPPVWFDIRARIIWQKPLAVISRGAYHWQHEPCWYGVRTGRNAAWIGDRKQSTIWEIAIKHGMMGKAEENEDDFDAAHGTQKPVECMARPMRNHQGDAYDCFLGSGTTVIAAEQLDRTCYGVELDPANVDVIVERWQTYTGGKATREGKAQTVAVPAAAPAPKGGKRSKRAPATIAA